ncbi:MAG: ParB/Srx family N-terminal domain-containing protein [Syntrophales bacterium]|nr:ParB/Srx family N-terminal domain-containing protein [Syntrophales bacterium]
MRSKFTATGPIPVSEILLDQNNYRLGPLDSQMDCITIMFQEFGSKMVKIAGHIAKNGLSPKPVVVSKDNQGRWVVRDGNRRMTALRLLNNPAEAPEQYQKIFQNLKSNAVREMIPEAIDCLTADESIIIEYRKLEHMGPQDGIGQVDWDARAKDNLQADVDGKLTYPLARAICDYLEKKGVTEARSVSISNMQRLFQDTEVSKRLGIDWDGQNIKFAAVEDEVFNILKEIVIDFVKRGKKVNDIYYPPDRERYMNDLFGNRSLKVPTPLAKPVAPAAGMRGAGGVAVQTKIAAKAKSSWDRPRVIQPGAGLPVPAIEAKLNTILAELRSKINVREAPVSASVLIRLIIERSVWYYITKYNVTYQKDELFHIIEKVAEHMKVSKIINKQDYNQIRKMGNATELISAHTLNAWVHNSNYTPTPQDVCTFWDNIYPFLVKCWK